ncbi:acyl-protein synthetase [Aromatoleum toluvorans]|uniref:Acyl-protein synthetase n=1 Tax=Aromatoleum toluvorans TaxID=92002 RepID=A0ABX1PZX2_9RHOO|nr:acyl-protein synthetase [Aromatoleum toluvorans]NMG44987.1 acyl-protein synthetase [Aromatoleum toluvorans]
MTPNATPDIQPDPVRERLAARIRTMIAAGVDADRSPFDELAPEIFAWQFERNTPYREFCEAKGITPTHVTDWRQIPAFPTDSFKTAIVTSFPPEQAVMAQITSGTTANRRGQIFRDDIGRELILTANRTMTGAYLFPDFARGQRCRILILAPSPEMAPSMGMAVGMDETRRHFGTPDSRFLLDYSGLDIKGLIAALEQSEATGVPLAMIGSTSAFVYFFNACKARSLRFRLPAGSRIGDGGGYRGRFGELTQDDYFRLAEEILGIPASHCVNVLGMAESATNYFDDTLRAAVQGRTSQRRRLTPPWARVAAVGLDDLQPLPPGQVGLLRHYDLANLPTVLAVQTDNLGYVDHDGSFQIVGRAKIVDGKVAPLPSERPVGPMGDKRIFRFLEAYVNFSIRFKMGLARARQPAVADHALPAPLPMTPPVCPCDELSEEMLANPLPQGSAAAEASSPAR